MKILITGGAGYIGSIAAKYLIDSGYEITVADSLERGNEWAVDPRAEFLKGDLLDKKFIGKVFSRSFDGVIHFAGYISTGESIEKPELYYKNNIGSAMNVLEGMASSGSDNLVFSSSAGIYGDAGIMPISENSKCSPPSPYGETKLTVEKILKRQKIKSISLRYSNAAGAMPDTGLGEAHLPETHIIPLAIESAVKGKEFSLFGTDYPTIDGTCVRDYIHVLDLAEAHILALKALRENKIFFPAYNVGTGKGYSNKEIILMVEKISGKKIKIKKQERRKGDAAILVADNALIKKTFGFEPKHSDLKIIVQTAYNWYLKKIG